MAITVRNNFWPSAKYAKAFWTQHEIKPYQELLADTIEWAAPAADQTWLDLGCGGGAVTRAIWQRTEGMVESVTGIDCAAANEEAYERLRSTLVPAPGGRVQFLCHDFSSGLDLFADASFDHVVSGLSISYAESFDERTGQWTTKAYDHLLSEVRRVIRPGGRFVFSVNVPEPSWGRVAWQSLPGLFSSRFRLHTLKRQWRMLRYGRWLKREARVGRFHYLPAGDVEKRLAAVGFTGIAHRLSYCDQAYIFRATVPN
jgi:SAM-dependent methyltransferase